MRYAKLKLYLDITKTNEMSVRKAITQISLDI